MSDVPSFSLGGKVVVQFGGTGVLGRSLVTALAGAGATLIVASRNRDSLASLATKEHEAGRTVHVDEVDIGSEASLQALRDRILATHGRIDGIVFNAVSRPMKSYDDNLAAWQASMDVNATGFFATVRAFGDAMVGQKSGSIVNIASQMGSIGMNPWLYEETPMQIPPDYFFHKGGMINLTRYLASHYGSHNVRVNVVSPGGIYNPDQPQAEAFVTRYGKMTMLGRLAQAREIGGSVVFLLSDASTYVTGTNIAIDGGYTAK
ncbi:SDR family oxidoreductase [Synoicihabitans lomoniglobus]|uniref:SDR family oxidoreductase n=1 Tax=Synoicihabitans lomoniglobus TaxID=2909285 RepID=A0AAF0CMR9_9BACT|nr:SDR family oxidoreductase [Opitutaceae bacterium LMO-M01]WED63696.1 SDR family oxidoreductase [Opitutaceae bacterium LMO-M01]